MRNEVKVKRNIYIILAIVFLLGLCLELTRSQFILQWSSRKNLTIANEEVVPQDGISESELAKIKQDQFLIVFDPENEESLKLKDNVAQVLTYMKKDYDVVDVYHFYRVDKPYSTVVLTFEELKKITDIDAVVEYVASGGNVFLGMRPDMDDAFYRIYRKLGINSLGDYLEVKGIHVTSNLLIQNDDLQVEGEFFVNSSSAVELDEQRCKVYAQTPNQVPLMWDTTFEKGKFMVFNGTILHEKIARGLIAGGLSLLQPDFMYPVMNMKILYIDDFPAPFPEGVNPQIYKDYQKDIPSFYRDIWWPHMIKDAARYDLKYTGLIIQTYNDRVSPPFDDHSGEGRNNLITFGRDLLKSGGELGYHGYNHQSLVTDQSIVNELGYKAWPSLNNISESLKELRAYTQAVYPDYTVLTYVPPSNIIGPEGLEAIAEVLPDVRIISGVYHEDVSGKAYVQEFSKGDHGMIDLPRLTAGYEYHDNNKFAIASGLTSLGVFSHFIHPDDILDKERSSGKAWPELSEEYDQMLGDVKSNYPWLRSMTASEAGKELGKYLSTKVYLKHQGKFIHGYLNHFTGEMYFILRTDKSISSTKQCSFKKIDDGVYLIQAQQPQFEIELEG